MNIIKLMTPKSSVAYLEDDDTIRQGIEKMKYHGFSAIPVINKADGTYFGTVTEGDFLWNIVKENEFDLIKQEDKYIRDIISPDRNRPIRITASGEELMERLLYQNFVPVTDDRGVFVGIVTRRSVMHHLKEMISPLPAIMKSETA